MYNKLNCVCFRALQLYVKSRYAIMLNEDNVSKQHDMTENILSFDKMIICVNVIINLSGCSMGSVRYLCWYLAVEQY